MAMPPCLRWQFSQSALSRLRHLSTGTPPLAGHIQAPMLSSALLQTAQGQEATANIRVGNSFIPLMVIGQLHSTPIISGVRRQSYQVELHTGHRHFLSCLTTVLPRGTSGWPSTASRCLGAGPEALLRFSLQPGTGAEEKENCAACPTSRC